MNILITGASGFLGGSLAGRLAVAGHAVTGTVRRPQSRIPAGCNSVVFSLTEPQTIGSLAGIDCIIHCSYDVKASIEVNVSGTLALCSRAEADGVKRQIFVGSYAARPESTAQYGRIKHELETLFRARGHTVVRPGLVIGCGGMFGRVMRTVSRFPVIPLLDGGAHQVPVIALKDFLVCMEILVREGRIGTYNLFNPDLVPTRHLMETIARCQRRQCWFFSISADTALRVLAVIERLPLPLPVGSDNVRSIRSSTPGVMRSDLHEFLASPETLESMVAAAVSRC